MGIQNWSNDTLLVDLPDEPDLQEELEEVARLVRDRGACDVVMDFSAVTLLNSTCLARLLQLRQQLLDRGRRLVLCNISRLIHGILSVTGLTRVFEIMADRSDALAAVALLTDRLPSGPGAKITPEWFWP